VAELLTTSGLVTDAAGDDRLPESNGRRSGRRP
jgi:hypothetical protein